MLSCPGMQLINSPVFFLRSLSAPTTIGIVFTCDTKSLFVGVPLAGNNNETFCIYTGAFWVQAVRLSLGLRKVD